ncbi:hypothetical protein [Streptomyces sp. NPDC051577]
MTSSRTASTVNPGRLRRARSRARAYRATGPADAQVLAAAMGFSLL